MNEVGNLKTVCEFILNWFGVDGTYPGDPLNDADINPDCFVTLNSMLGGLWNVGEHPIKCLTQHHRSNLGLFAIQNIIENPVNFKLDDDGVIGVIFEDQGVTNFGFRKEEPSQALVCGAWSDMTDGPWRKIDDRLEDILVYFLFTNFCFLATSDRDLVDDEAKEKANTLLWCKTVHAAPRPVWTNESRDILRFPDLGFSLAKPVKK